MNKIILLFISTMIVSQIAAQNEFITTWKTDNPGDPNPASITIPTGEGTGYNYDVSWQNDGNWEVGFTGNATHIYEVPGTYTVAIRGSFPQIYFEYAADQQKILSVEQWGNIQWQSMYGTFFNCNNLVINAVDVPDLSMVTNMAYMFLNAFAFNQNIGNWDVSNVTNMSGMFYISEGNTSSTFNQDIGNWDVSNVTDMSSMFANSSFNQNIGNWNVSSVTDMNNMFANNTAFDQDIGNWDVSNVNLMVNMFAGASNFNQDIANWDVSNVVSMFAMFHGALKFNQDIGIWDVSKVTDMSYMFSGATAFDQNIGNWDVSNVTYMSEFFNNGAGLSTAHYDALLTGWSNLTLQDSVTFNGGSSTYCTGENARDNLISEFGWTITDGGSLLGTPCDINGMAGEYGADCSCIPFERGDINGVVDWSGVCGSRDITIEIYSVEEPHFNETYYAVIDANGGFTSPDFRTGTYNVLIKVEGYLAKSLRNQTILEGTNFIEFGSIIPGDLTGDNAVSIGDVSFLNASFGMGSSTANYNYLADLNCNGNINIMDLSLLNAGFGMVGEHLND